MSHLLQTVISKKAVLRLEFSADTPPIEADATQIRQVVMNLITNASDAIGDKSGFITVRTGLVYADEQYLHSTYLKSIPEPGYFAFLEVSDTGIGMDVATQAKVFDPFFSTKFTGRGLGLAAVLGIVRGHGGSVKVYSEPGRGTTFKVLLPCSEAHPLAGQKPAPPDDRATRLSGCALVAEDDESVAAVARAVLRRAGMEVVLAADGRAALDLFYADPERYNIVIVDLTMPHLGGEDVFRKLRLTHSALPVIIVSGYSEQEVSPSFAGKGLAGFVQKPYKPQELLAAVAAALERADSAEQASG
jgi:CheY-like chemotaxis protein